MILHRLPHQINRLPPEFRKFIHEQNAAVCQCDDTRTRHSSASRKSRSRHRVVRRQKRPLRDETLSLRNHTGDAVNGRNLKTLLPRQRRKNASEPLREHTFSSSRRADHQNVMKACSRDLQHTLCRLLPVDFSKIRHFSPCISAEQSSCVHFSGPYDTVSGGPRLQQIPDHLPDRADADNIDIWHNSPLHGVLLRHNHGVASVCRRTLRHRQHAPDRLDLSVKSQLPGDHHPFCILPRDDAECRQNSCRYRQIQNRAPLWDICRRDIHRNTGRRDGDPRIPQRNTHPLAGFLHLRSEESHHRESRQPVRDVRLHLQQAGIQSEHRAGFNTAVHEPFPFPFC